MIRPVKSWPGPDVSLSIAPEELRDLIDGSRAIHQALGGRKTILPEERPTIDFAYACVVATRDIVCGERFSKQNIWVKRPGTGEIKAVDYDRVLDHRAAVDITADTQLKWSQIGD